MCGGGGEAPGGHAFQDILSLQFETRVSKSRDPVNNHLENISIILFDIVKFKLISLSKSFQLTIWNILV